MGAAALLVLELDSIYELIKQDQKIILVYLFVNLLLLSVVGLFRMIKLIVRPIDRIVEMTDSYQDGYIDSQAPRILLGRIGQGEELAAAAIWLASPAAGYVTGQTIPVDGGITVT